MNAPVAVVTGGARGLGEAIVRRLHADGYRIAIADVHPAPDLVSELDGTGATVREFAVDVRERTELERLRDAVVAEFGDVQVLVNNAARTQAKPLFEITPEELDDVLAVNVGGTFAACQVFGEYLAGRGYGRIVNMASLAGQNGGTTTGGHYAASKGAIITVTKVFARELAARGVTVNAVSPGPQDSPAVREIVGDTEALAAAIPVGRLGDPGFVARMVALLASPEAASVTGACWDANGGLYLR
ncbi:SDR family NAD(P)-dependent oxidoreductase [Amycolatopsis jejuensis]|uniref:SDR family NAD(P)-dependent oxidoreductase n=1 Tax=Amycolatopsis jejuensis TaxID=330084 RepID=UPI0005264AA2|nr:SDR family oxidoreductase [Amycolatopsis jejuensis]